MDMFARDYAALADALGLTRICVIGLSQGGMVAQKLALLRPDLVSSLVLISTVVQVRAVAPRQHGGADRSDGEDGSRGGRGDRGGEHLFPGMARCQCGGACKIHRLAVGRCRRRR